MINKQSFSNKIFISFYAQLFIQAQYFQCFFHRLHTVVHTREELKNALETALSDKEIGILLLTEKFGREFPEIVDDVKLNHKIPLIIEIPDRHGTGRKPNFITSYVNEAIGLKL